MTSVVDMNWFSSVVHRAASDAERDYRRYIVSIDVNEGPPADTQRSVVDDLDAIFLQ